MSETHDEQPVTDHDLLVRIAGAVERIGEELTALRGVLEDINPRDPYEE